MRKLSIFLFGLFISACLLAQNSEIQSILLPSPNVSGDVSIEEVLNARRSVRQYADSSLSINEISQLLWAAYGVTKSYESPTSLRGGLKTSPSAGALYPLELYLVAWNIDQLENGIYKYFSEDHSLKLVMSGDKRDELSTAAWDQSWLKDAAGAIVYSAVFSRTTDKYGERGKDRYVCMDVGHSAQNVYLQGVALRIGTCAIGAFNDNKLKELINMPEDETPLYIMPIGKMVK